MNINEFVKENKSLLADYIAMSVNAANRADYIQGGGGNTSVKLRGDLMAIKASGFSMGQITEETAYAVLDTKILRDFYFNTNPATLSDVEAEGSQKAKDAGVKIEGLKELRPSVEAGFHSILGTFVLHTHSVYANLLSCSKEGRDLLEKALKGADYTFGFVPYVNPGAKLTFTIRDEINSVKDATGTVPKLLLMENHGVIAHGDTFEEAQQIHDDANLRFAELMNISWEDFPAIQVEGNDNRFVSATPWLKERLAGGEYTEKFLMEDSLYPDQLVFLGGNIAYVDSLQNSSEKKCSIVKNTGEICYNCNESEALVIEQTLCCVIFIAETLGKNGYTLQSMDSSGKDFIAGWESEAYRKSLLK